MTSLAALPASPGVYRFRDARGRALYIGRATQLRSRVASYWGELRGRRHLARMVPQIARVEAVACDSVHEAAWLERNLLQRSKPRWNRIRGGTESAVCIRLDALAPRLSLAHWPLPAGDAQLFGPYLGGSQGRLAVAALDRVLPLRYTDDRLGGGLRDLARIRGVSSCDREAFLSTIVAVLRGDPASVGALRDTLTGQRDRAAGNLAFELAARIQQEIEAVDWIAAEQKVTSLRPVDHDIYGWSDGLLTHFQIRAGRLDGWSQRPCGRAAAQPFVARTPAAWTTFADRNAELAARLLDAG
jgi:excinuclease ABC subunit C